LALPSNIGHYYRSTFSVVPETGIEIGYRLTPRLRGTVGYRLLYWTQVARPGNQTDRTVNPAQVQTDAGVGIGGGPARPALPLRNTQPKGGDSCQYRTASNTSMTRWQAKATRRAQATPSRAGMLCRRARRSNSAS